MAGKADGSVIIDTRMNTSGFQTGVANIKRGFSGLSSALGKIAKVMVGVFAVKQLVNFGREAIELGSDLSEVQNVVDVTFGNLNQEINNFASNAIEQFGLSETAAKQYTSTMGAMLKSMGFTTREAADMSMTMTGLAADMASFYNLNAEDAFYKIRAGISGETEPLKQLGINLNVANLEQYALTQGITKSYNAMTQQEQAMLRYNYLLKVTADAQGDFARTSDSWANQTRILAERFKALKATIGQGLINIFLPVIKVINTLLAKLATVANAFKAFTELITGKKSSGTTSGSSAGITGSNMPEIAENYDTAAEGAENYAGATEDAVDATKKANKANRTYLSGLDEVKRYTEDIQEDDTSMPSLSGGEPLNVAEMQDAVDDIDYGNLAEGETVLDGIDSNIGKIIETLKKLRDILTKGFFDGLGNYKPILEEMRLNFQLIRAALVNIFTAPEVLASIQNFAKNFTYMLGAIAGSFVRNGITIANNIIGGIEICLSENTERIKQWISSIFDIGSQLSLLVAQFHMDYADIFSIFGSETAQQITANLLSIFAETFMGITEFIGVAVLDIVNQIVTIFDENKERIKESLAGTLEGLEEITGSINNMIQFITQTVLPDLGNGIKNLLDIISPFTAFLSDVFFSIWNDMLNPALQYFGSEILPQITAVLEQLWNNVFVPLGNYISSIFSPIFQFLTSILSSLWHNVVVPLAQAIGSVLKAAWENLYAILNQTVIPIILRVIEVLQYLWNNVGLPIVSFFQNTFGPVFDRIFKGIGGVIDGLKQSLVGIMNFIGGVFTGNWEKAWNGIKNIFGGVFNALISLAKTPINAIIGVINGLIRGVVSGINTVINALNRIHITIPSWVPAFGGKGFGFNIPQLSAPQIPYLATGAVIPPNAPFAAVLGDQKRGNNIEAPEDLLRKIVREETGGRSTGNNTYEFIAQLNRRTIFDEIVAEAKLRQSKTGRNPFELA